jgi:hypothetical protein
MKYLRILAVTAIPVAAFVAIEFGGPKSLPPMASVNDPFNTVDFSDLPPLRHFAPKMALLWPTVTTIQLARRLAEASF